MPEKDKHANSGVPYSRELDEEDKNFIRGMESWKESTQLPMLTDKIIVLSKSVRKLNKYTIENPPIIMANTKTQKLIKDLVEKNPRHHQRTRLLRKPCQAS